MCTFNSNAFSEFASFDENRSDGHPWAKKLSNPIIAGAQDSSDIN